MGWDGIRDGKSGLGGGGGMGDGSMCMYTSIHVHYAQSMPCSSSVHIHMKTCTMQSHNPSLRTEEVAQQVFRPRGEVAGPGGEAQLEALGHLLVCFRVGFWGCERTCVLGFVVLVGRLIGGLVDWLVRVG